MGASIAIGRAAVGGPATGRLDRRTALGPAGRTPRHERRAAVPRTHTIRAGVELVWAVHYPDHGSAGPASIAKDDHARRTSSTGSLMPARAISTDLAEPGTIGVRVRILTGMTLDICCHRISTMSRRRIRPEAPTPDVTVRHASDLLAVIPYLVGFHPTESIVAVLMRSGQVALTMRVDLPTTPSVAEAGAALARQLTAVARTNRLTRMVLVGYSADPLRANRVLTATMDEIAPQRRAGPRVGRRLLRRRRTLVVADLQRAVLPARGHARTTWAQHPYAAEAVFAGMSVEPSRAALEEGLLGPDPADVAGLEETLAAVLDEPGRARRPGVGPARRFSRPSARRSTGPRSATRSAPGLALLAMNKTVRDLAWAMIDPRRRRASTSSCGAGSSAGCRRRCRPRRSACSGMAAWISGNGALLNCLWGAAAPRSIRATRWASSCWN